VKEEVELLLAARDEQQHQLRELTEKLASLTQIQEERDKTHALVSRIRFNLKLPPLGAIHPDLMEHQPSVDPTDSPVLRKALAVLEEKLAALDQQLLDLREAKGKREDIQGLLALMNESLPASESVPIEIELSDSISPTDAVSPLWIMIRIIILNARTPLSLATITETLRAIGFTRVSSETVRNAISRKPDVFQRRGEGYVVISEDVRPEDRG
jgi:hypothetical protein